MLAPGVLAVLQAVSSYRSGMRILEQNLAQAAKPNAAAQQQSQALQNAAKAQQQTAKALDALAENLDSDSDDVLSQSTSISEAADELNAMLGMRSATLSTLQLDTGGNISVVGVIKGEG